MTNPETPLKSIPRISPKYQKSLAKLGLSTVRDFLYYFPFRYDDFRETTSPSKEYIGKTITVIGKITKTRNNRIFRKKMTVTEILLESENRVEIKSIWFNQPYILDSLSPGVSVRLSGKLSLNGKYFQMTNPAWEKASREETNTGRLVPVYSETAGITSKWIRWQMKILLSDAKKIDDPVPAEILGKYNLYDLETALTQLHFPDSKENLIRAQKRMAFEKMFLLQLKALEIKKDWEKKNSLDIKFDEKLVKDFVAKLPFKLTDAQRKATFEILKDLEKIRPMNRLLNGDVGSGKTVVAGIAAFQTISAGYQSAIMAPTEVLARQHFESFCELFKDYGINIALLTHSHKLLNTFSGLAAKSVARGRLIEEIGKGGANLIIGTHALIQKDVEFKKLALVVIDEQHRFGVSQRAALQQKTMEINDGDSKIIPHLLTMTATPIPRTLSIALFGSLDLSILDEMPKNRKPIITRIIAPDGREKVYEFVKKEIKKGRQTFVILPLIEESKSEMMIDVRAAAEEHKRLSEKIFPEFKLGLLHGRLKTGEKEETMKKFKNKELDIMVSTSVVEVGVDVPNATVMIIENAERFGLSQLHQFRGRVGRGKNQSYCFLFSETASKRLDILEKSSDGFKIAEKDLSLRGPGQFFGTLQSGISDIPLENLTNVRLIKFARAEAAEILKKDPELKGHPALRVALFKFLEKVHLE